MATLLSLPLLCRRRPCSAPQKALALCLSLALLVPLALCAEEFDADIIIVGLGPIGMVMSHLLSAYGVKNVLAFERTDDVYLGPRAVAWDDYTVRTSRTMGLEMEDWMRTHYGLFADQWAFRCQGLKSGSADSRWGSCDTYDSNEKWRQNAMESTRQPSVYFHQPTWERWLRQGLAGLGQRYYLNTEVIEVKDIDGHCEVAVQATEDKVSDFFAEGETGVKKVRAKYCLAADGGSSRIRRQLGLSYEGQTFQDQPWLVVDTEIEDVSYLKTSWVGDEGVGFVMNPKCPFVFIFTPAFFSQWWEEAEAEAASQTSMPKGSEEFRALRQQAMRRLAAERIPKTQPHGNQTMTTTPEKPLLPPGTHFRFEFLVPPNMSAEEATDPVFVNELLEGCAEVDPKKLDIKRVVVYTFHARRASKWRVGPILLAGDSAHCMPPFQGQGMNSGIRDVANLAWKLNLILKGLADDAILDSYEPERRTNLQQVTEESVFLGKLVMVEKPWLAAVRDYTMSVFTWLRKTIPFLFDGIQYMIFVDPPHISSNESLVSSETQKVAGRLLPCPDVYLAGHPWKPLPMDKIVAPTGFTVVFPSDDRALSLTLDASARSLDLLQKLNAAAIAIASFKADATAEGASDAPVLKGLPGGRCRDAVGQFSSWVKRNGLEEKVLLVRPDRYIFGAFDSVDAALESLGKMLKPGSATGGPQKVEGTKPTEEL